MKIIYLAIATFLITQASFAQIVQKRQMQKKKDTVAKPPVVSTTVHPAVPVKTVTATPVKPAAVATSKINTAQVQPAIKTTAAATTTQPKQVAASLNANVQSNVVKATNTSRPVATSKVNNAGTGVQAVTVQEKKSELVPGPKYSTVPVSESQAKLVDVFVSVSTGMSAELAPGVSDNKDKDTHWSCGTFDQNERPVTSFHDDSNDDEYPEGSNNVLRMKIDNPAIFGDFQRSGRLHINIAPVGHDTWYIEQLTLTLNFQNPNVSQTITWLGINLTQDQRNADLYFYYDGKNYVARN